MPADKAKHQIFKKNDIMLREGAVSEFCFLIIKGEVEVRKNYHGSNPRTVARLGKGSVIGEMALFDGHPHVATVIALQDTEVAVMSSDEFKRLVNGMDPLMRGIVGMLVMRLRQTVDELVPKSGDVNWADWKKK